MTGGTITGNSANGSVNGSGGGVSVRKGTFTMEGGEISGNTAIGGQYGNGGGVTVQEGSVFTMTSGMISGNTATGIENNGNAGGVRVSGGSTFTMKGGTISANTATSRTRGSAGGGVQVNESMFIMEGGTIYGNADSLPAGTDVSLANSANSAVSLRVWKSTAKWGMGGTYKGGDSQTGGSDIVLPKPNTDVFRTDDTLIAIPKK
jgi:hypothetical protein